MVGRLPSERVVCGPAMMFCENQFYNLNVLMCTSQISGVFVHWNSRNLLRFNATGSSKISVPQIRPESAGAGGRSIFNFLKTGLN